MATKTRGMLEVDKPLLDRIRRTAKQQGRKVNFVGRMVITKGLEVLEREQNEQPSANVAGGH